MHNITMQLTRDVMYVYLWERVGWGPHQAIQPLLKFLKALSKETGKSNTKPDVANSFVGEWHSTAIGYQDISCSITDIAKFTYLLHWAVFWIWYILICLLHWPRCTKDSEQTEQWYGRSPVWRRMWDLRLYLAVNFWEQTLHWYGLSPVWQRRCDLRWGLCENVWGQKWHLKGRSPVWVRKCTLRLNSFSVM